MQNTDVFLKEVDSIHSKPFIGLIWQMLDLIDKLISIIR